MKKYAIIVAGGSGSRMGEAIPKQFLPLLGKPVLWYTLRAFLDAYSDLNIVLVLPARALPTRQSASSGPAGSDAAHFLIPDPVQSGPAGPDTADSLILDQEIRDLADTETRIRMTAGGETRFSSVARGLELVSEPSIVLVHDAVRCLVTPRLIRHCYESALIHGNAVPAVAPVDTIRLETPQGYQPLDRNKIRIIQTPQTFSSEVLKTAFRQPYDESFTDEASVVERLGITIHLVEGEVSNIKITRPVDMLIAENILRARIETA